MQSNDPNASGTLVVDNEVPDDFDWEAIDENEVEEPLPELDSQPKSQSQTSSENKCSTGGWNKKAVVSADPMDLEAGEIEQTEQDLQNAERLQEQSQAEREKANDNLANNRNQRNNNSDGNSSKKPGKGWQVWHGGKDKITTGPIPRKENRGQKQYPKKKKKSNTDSRQMSCDLCGISVTGQVAMDSHLKGKKHRQAVAQEKMNKRQNEVTKRKEIANPVRSPPMKRDPAPADKLENIDSQSIQRPSESAEAPDNRRSSGDLRDVTREIGQMRVGSNCADPSANQSTKENQGARNSRLVSQPLPKSVERDGTSRQDRGNSRPETDLRLRSVPHPNSNREVGDRKRKIPESVDNRQARTERIATPFQESGDGSSRRRLDATYPDNRRDDDPPGASFKLSRFQNAPHQPGKPRKPPLAVNPDVFRQRLDKAPTGRSMVPKEWLEAKMSTSEWREMRHHVLTKGTMVDKLTFKILQEIILSPILGIRFEMLKPFSDAMVEALQNQEIVENRIVAKFSDYPKEMTSKIEEPDNRSGALYPERQAQKAALRLIMDNLTYMFDATQDSDNVKLEAADFPRRGSFGARRSPGNSRSLQTDDGRPPKYGDSVELDPLFNQIIDQHMVVHTT